MLLPQLNVLKVFTRNVSKRPFVWYGEGIKYPGFIYYPRYSYWIIDDNKNNISFSVLDDQITKIRPMSPQSYSAFSESNLSKDAHTGKRI